MDATRTSAEIEFPLASILRVVRTGIPENMNISKDARAAFSKAATIFALYLTATYARN